MRPPVERYCRCVSVIDNIELILGVQMDSPGEYLILLSTSQMLLRDAVASLSGSHAVTNPALLAEAVECEVVKQWPERYWFLEVCSEGDRSGWVQCFQPAPRNCCVGPGPSDVGVHDGKGGVTPLAIWKGQS